MSQVNEKYIGESMMKEEPKKKVGLVIKDKAVKDRHIDDDAVITRCIEDKAVTPKKLSDSVQGAIVEPLTRQLDQKYRNITNELYSMVASLQVGGIALSQQFGDREDVGISQKTLTKTLGKILDELGTVTGKTYMDFTFTVEPSTIYAEQPADVRITADCTQAISDFDSIKIYIDDALVAESSDTSVFTVSETILQTCNVKAVGVVMGKTIVKAVEVVKDVPFFMGSGSVYTDVMNEECRKILDGSLEGDYDVTIKHTGDYMFIIIPISHKDEFRRADMNGLALKVEIPLSAEEHEDFVVYKSLNTYKAGTYNIDIDINS